MQTLRIPPALQPPSPLAAITGAIVLQIATLTLLLLKLTTPAYIAGLATLQLMLVPARVLFLRRHAEHALDAADRRERELREQLRIANTDPVTGLPNRRLIYHHIEGTPTTAEVTVAFLDVDDLKQVNDTYGHQAGDQYLAALAERLSTVTIGGDTLVHLGGDEFALATTRTPLQLAAALARVLREPADIAGHHLLLRASVGIARVTGGNAHVALGQADLAMYTAKRRRSVIEHYDPVRDGTPLPVGVRAAVRPRDRRPGTHEPIADY